MLETCDIETNSIYKFYKGYIKDYPVIIAKTEVGLVNSASCLTIAIEKSIDKSAIILLVIVFNLSSREVAKLRLRLKCADALEMMRIAHLEMKCFALLEMHFVH